jgi:O-acetyl-ADP-ribose deacetylase (regulator of RNase III)
MRWEPGSVIDVNAAEESVDDNYGTVMKITLLQEDVGKISADGLVLPVDGQICAIGGTATAKVLKESFAREAEDAEEQIELYTYAEDDVFRLKPLQHGSSAVIPGNEVWLHLVVIAAFYHNVDDVVFSQQQACDLLTRAIQSGVRVASRHNMQSVAMTLMGTTYRVTPEQSILALTKGLAAVREEAIEIKWCILGDKDFEYAKRMIFGL